jgi:anti-sigma factor RsiW
MNQDKAREFFSAYYEGNLERGLRQTMEQRLHADAQLQAEYRAFQRTMDQLDNLKFEEIEAPSYLSDRIATRIEEARVASRPRNPFLLWLPRYAVAGLAAVALAGATFAIFSHGGSYAPSSITPGTSNLPLTPPPAEIVSVSGTAQHVVLHYQSASARSVQVLDATGQKLKSYPLAASQQLNANLDNPNPEAVLFEVKASENGPDVFVAVPGTNHLPSSKDSGSVGDFASALADTFGAPVIVNVPDLTKTVSWTLAGADARGQALKALEGTDYEVSQTASGVLSISKKS